MQGHDREFAVKSEGCLVDMEPDYVLISLTQGKRFTDFCRIQEFEIRSHKQPVIAQCKKENIRRPPFDCCFREEIIQAPALHIGVGIFKFCKQFQALYRKVIGRCPDCSGLVAVTEMILKSDFPVQPLHVVAPDETVFIARRKAEVEFGKTVVQCKDKIMVVYLGISIYLTLGEIFKSLKFNGFQKLFLGFVLMLEIVFEL